MRWEFHNRWVRLLVEFLPASPAIRRYRVVPARLHAEIGRFLQGQIARQLQRPISGEAAITDSAGAT